MSDLTCKCGKKVSPKEVFTLGESVLCESCYLGSQGRGPLAEQFIECPKCNTTIHKFSVACLSCGASIREIGKVETAGKGSATKGIFFVLGIVALAMAAMIVGDRAVSSKVSLGKVIPMSITGFLLGIDGLLGLLYFRFFAGVKFIRGLPGFGLGAASFILSGVLFILLLT